MAGAVCAPARACKQCAACASVTGVKPAASRLCGGAPGRAPVRLRACGLMSLCGGRASHPPWAGAARPRRSRLAAAASPRPMKTSASSWRRAGDAPTRLARLARLGRPQWARPRGMNIVISFAPLSTTNKQPTPPNGATSRAALRSSPLGANRSLSRSTNRAAHQSGTGRGALGSPCCGRRNMENHVRCD